MISRSSSEEVWILRVALCINRLSFDSNYNLAAPISHEILVGSCDHFHSSFLTHRLCACRMHLSIHLHFGYIQWLLVAVNEILRVRTHFQQVLLFQTIDDVMLGLCYFLKCLV